MVLFGLWVGLGALGYGLAFCDPRNRVIAGDLLRCWVVWVAFSLGGVFTLAFGVLTITEMVGRWILIQKS